VRLLLVTLTALTLSAAEGTFQNPLLPSGADPQSIHHDGWYYYTHTTGRNLTLWRTQSIARLAEAEKRVVWTPPADTAWSKQIWAPELHRIDGKWYLYFAADDGRNRNHRLYVIENASRDPMQGEWVFRGQVKTPDDKWAIDASVFPYGGRWYLLWSGWEGDENGRQDLYIARLTNPWTTMGPRVRISKPELAWETVGDIGKPGPDDKPHVDVNEGPEALVRNGRVFIVYSGSGCWTDSYALGMVWADAGSDLLSAKSWKKWSEPVFRAQGVSGTFAAGHHSFFRSPDGTQDWILYHANSEAGQGCGAKRSPRAQPFRWRADGFPDFGQPVPAGVELPIPSEGVK